MTIALLALLLAQDDFTALYRQALSERIANLGAKHPKTAESMRDLGLHLKQNGAREEAAHYLRQALAMNEKAGGIPKGGIAEDLENLASVLPPMEAIAHYKRAIAVRTSEGESLALADTLEHAAELTNGPEAEPMLRKALAIRTAKGSGSDARSANLMNTLGLLLQEHRPKEAESLFRKATRINRVALARGHPETAATLNNLASLLLATGRAADAEPLQREALAALEASLGPEHPRVAIALSNLADILRAKGLLSGAEKLYRRTLAIDEKVYGPNHPEVAADLENLASLLDQRGRSAAARAYRDRAQTIRGR